jgi:amino acid transporter
LPPACTHLQLLINFLGTRAFGEMEFWAASIKVITICGLIIVSIVITAGGGPNHEAIGFRFWNETGGFVQYDGIPGKWGRFLGFFAVLISAAFAFIGTVSRDWKTENMCGLWDLC